MKSFLLLTILIVFFECCKSKPYGDTKKNEFADKVDRVNLRLTYTILRHNIMSMVSDNTPGYQYDIKLKDSILSDTSLCYFGKREYIISAKHEFDTLKRKNLCQLIDRINNSVNASIENVINELRTQRKNYIDSLFPGRSEKIQVIVAEIYYAIFMLSKDDNVDIFIKGYGDRYTADWEMPLNNKYEYEDIEFNPRNDTSLHRLTTYSGQEEKHKIVKKQYTNRDLPYLRAKFVKEAILKPMIIDCAIKVRNIQILENKQIPFTDEVYPDQRKVRIFINYLGSK